MLNTEPLVGVDSLRFGKSTTDDCLVQYGTPTEIRINSLSEYEYHYASYVLRFNGTTKLFQELSLMPPSDAIIGNLPVTWDRHFLALLCDADGSPHDSYGFIVMRKLGIAVTGIHDNDESQLAVTAFIRGRFDTCYDGDMPFDPSILK